MAAGMREFSDQELDTVSRFLDVMAGMAAGLRGADGGGSEAG